LLIVFAAIAVVAALRRFASNASQPALKFATYAIGITSGFWFIERIIV
jgi:ABC-type nickel/cobalt efflux system permease component RcnA